MREAIAMMKVTEALLEAIPEKGIPSGHLYAAVMGHLTLDQYQHAMTAAKSADAVREVGHYLTRGTRYEFALKGLRDMIAQYDK